MNSTVIVLTPPGLRIPTELSDLSAFRAWVNAAELPHGVRIDYLAGEVEIDMSPEDVTTHGTPKAALVAGLHGLVVERLDLGLVLTDSSRLTAPAADLSAEPDVLVVLSESLRSGRVRLVPRVDAAASRYTEIEGAADLVVECVSDSSVTKVSRVLLDLYHRAGVREYWLVDARPVEAVLAIHQWTADGYTRIPGDDAGFVSSPLLGCAFRLARREPVPGIAVYRLHERPQR
jgi:Uma2 family endonuclease